MIELIDHTHYVKLLLNDPGSKNSLSLKALLQLTEYCQQIAVNPQWRFVILEGAGDVFCSGANLKEMKNSMIKSEKENLNDAHILYQAFESFWQTPQPIITRVQGAAMGGGLGLIALSDYVLAEEDSRFCFSEVKLGLAPAVISNFILKKFSLAQIQQWLIFSETFSPEIAKHIGLVHQITHKGESSKELDHFIKKIFNLSPQSLRETKILLRTLLNTTNQTIRKKITTQLIARLRTSSEGQEGLKSFFEQRPPSWVIPPDKK